MVDSYQPSPVNTLASLYFPGFGGGGGDPQLANVASGGIPSATSGAAVTWVVLLLGLIAVRVLWERAGRRSE